MPVDTAGMPVFSTVLFHAKKIIFAIALLYCVDAAAQQNTDTAYQRVIAERTAKIVNTLGITDAVLNKKVQQQIGTLANNLGKLNSIYGNMLTAMQGR